MPGPCVSPSLLRVRAVLQHVQQDRFAGQLLQLVAEPVHFRTAMAERQARPGGADINPDVVQVPADSDRVARRSLVKNVRTTQAANNASTSPAKIKASTSDCGPPGADQ